MRWMGVVLMVAAGLGSAAAQKPDLHFDDARAAALYHRSAFAHGYLHGYEAGFHVADQDIHTGHLQPGQAIAVPKPRGDSGFQTGFGDKKLFSAGFRQGFRAGYTDSINDREFRALRELREAAADLDPHGPARPFDRNFSSGYLSARETGQAAAPSASACGLPAAAAHAPEDCDAFGRGYRLGVADARLAPSTVTARKMDGQ